MRSVTPAATSMYQAISRGTILLSFSIFGKGEKQYLDVTKAVRHWAAGGSNEGLVFSVKPDRVKYSDSVCLKYFGKMILNVKYIDYR